MDVKCKCKTKQWWSINDIPLVVQQYPVIGKWLRADVQECSSLQRGNVPGVQGCRNAREVHACQGADVHPSRTSQQVPFSGRQRRRKRGGVGKSRRFLGEGGFEEVVRLMPFIIMSLDLTFIINWLNLTFITNKLDILLFIFIHFQFICKTPRTLQQGQGLCWQQGQNPFNPFHEVAPQKCSLVELISFLNQTFTWPLLLCYIYIEWVYTESLATGACLWLLIN